MSPAGFSLERIPRRLQASPTLPPPRWLWAPAGARRSARPVTGRLRAVEAERASLAFSALTSRSDGCEATVGAGCGGDLRHRGLYGTQQLRRFAGLQHCLLRIDGPRRGAADAAARALAAAAQRQRARPERLRESPRAYALCQRHVGHERLQAVPALLGRFRFQRGQPALEFHLLFRRAWSSPPASSWLPRPSPAVVYARFPATLHR